jgi:hypothetical protein
MATLKRLRRAKPKDGQRSLREIADVLAELGHLNAHGQTVRSGVDQLGLALHGIIVLPALLMPPSAVSALHNESPEREMIKQMTCFCRLIVAIGVAGRLGGRLARPSP